MYAPYQCKLCLMRGMLHACMLLGLIVVHLLFFLSFFVADIVVSSASWTDGSAPFVTDVSSATYNALYFLVGRTMIIGKVLVVSLTKRMRSRQFLKLSFFLLIQSYMRRRAINSSMIHEARREIRGHNLCEQLRHVASLDFYIKKLRFPKDLVPLVLISAVLKSYFFGKLYDTESFFKLCHSLFSFNFFLNRR